MSVAYRTTGPPDLKRAERARAAIEARDIHLAVCRYRRQGLVCSTCCDVVERAVLARGSYRLAVA
jgi:hypothetical protein